MLAFIHIKKNAPGLKRSFQVQREGVPSLFSVPTRRTWLVFGHIFHDCLLILATAQFNARFFSFNINAINRSNRHRQSQSAYMDEKQHVSCGVVVCFRIDSYFSSSAAQHCIAYYTKQTKQTHLVIIDRSISTSKEATIATPSSRIPRTTTPIVN